MRSADDISRAMTLHGDAVWRACAAYVSFHDAEDVFQDVFLKYALTEASFNGAEHEKAWLIRVAVNACKDVLKSARRKNVSLEDRLATYGEDSLGIRDDSSMREFEVKRILESMDALGDPPKTQLYLSIVEGYTAREIASMTNMPENTVYSWIARGKKRLKEVLCA